jgi:hypothetical protein
MEEVMGEKMTVDEFIEWMKEQEDFAVNDEMLDLIEQQLKKVWWTAVNRGATMERVRIQEGLQIPTKENGYKTKA